METGVEIDCTVKDAFSDEEYPARLPGEWTVGRTITYLCEELGSPILDQEGESTSPALKHSRTGRKLQNERTLEQEGVRDRDLLEFYQEPTAGCIYGQYTWHI